MNWVDLVAAVVFIGFAVRGLIKGFFRELFSLVGIFLALWVALLQFTPVAEWIRIKFPLTDPLPYHVAFLLLFFGISISASVCGSILHKLARVLFVGWLDAIVGLGLGLLKGVVVLLVLLFLMEYLPLPEAVNQALRTSTVVSHLKVANPFVEQSVRAYERFGDKHFWERLRVQESAGTPAMGDGRAAEEALTR